MRDIAAKAGVALGGAYYYFSAKDAIVLAFYRQMQESSHEAILEALAGRKKLRDRIRCVLEKRLELLEPNRKFCAALLRHAPDSADPLSPFSEESRPIREHAIEHMRIAVEGSDVKVPSDLKPRLPYLLWLYQMALIMFWLYDRSPGQERTRRLMEKSLGLLVEPPADFDLAADETSAQGRAGTGGKRGGVGAVVVSHLNQAIRCFRERAGRPIREGMMLRDLVSKNRWILFGLGVGLVYGLAIRIASRFHVAADLALA